MPIPQTEFEAALHNVAAYLHENAMGILPSMRAVVADRNDWKRIALTLARYVDGMAAIKLQGFDCNETLVGMPDYRYEELREFMTEEQLSTHKL